MTVSKHTEAWEQFVSEGTRENYRQIARDLAKTEDTTPEAALGKLADGFAEQHKSDHLGGWDYLEAWARSEGDPGDGADPANAEALVARAVESAKRDPKLALDSHPEAVAAAEEVLEERRTSSAGQEVDPESGSIPNPGPAVGVDVASTADRAEQAEHDEPAADQGDTSSSTSSSESTFDPSSY